MGQLNDDEIEQIMKYMRAVDNGEPTVGLPLPPCRKMQIDAESASVNALEHCLGDNEEDCFKANLVSNILAYIMYYECDCVPKKMYQPRPSQRKMAFDDAMKQPFYEAS